MTKKALQKTNSTALSRALSTDDKKLALRELSKLTIGKIMDAREHLENMKAQLEELRNSYRYFKANKGIPDRIKHMKTLKSIGADLAKVIADTPEVPILYELCKRNEEDLLATIQLMIVDVVEYFHTTTTMAPAMIEELSLRIALTFGGLTLEDLGLCFHQAKSGQSGKVYNRIDGAVIMDWLHEYQGNVQAVGMERNRRQHNQSKTGIWKEGHEYRIVQPKQIKHLM